MLPIQLKMIKNVPDLTFRMVSMEFHSRILRVRQGTGAGKMPAGHILKFIPE